MFLHLDLGYWTLKMLLVYFKLLLGWKDVLKLLHVSLPYQVECSINLNICKTLKKSIAQRNHPQYPRGLLTMGPFILKAIVLYSQ